MTIWYDHEMTKHTTLQVLIAFVGVIWRLHHLFVRDTTVKSTALRAWYVFLLAGRSMTGTASCRSVC
jgi:hypothetical protein